MTKTNDDKTTKIKKAVTKKAAAITPEIITQAETGPIDLHLQTPEAVEQIINREIEKLNDGFHVVLFNPEQNKKTPREKISILKELVSEMTIKDESDTPAYERLDKTRKIIVKLRTGVVSKHKLLKENYLKVGKALDGEKNELSRLLEEVEQVAEQKLKVIDDAKAAKENEEKRLKQEKLDNRVKEIKANGMEFTGGFYTIGETFSVDIVTLENLSDELYASFLSRVKIENEKIKKTKLKAAQRVRVERYLLERQGRKQAAEAQRLQELAQQQKTERKNDRVAVLEMLGFTLRPGYRYVLKLSGEVAVSVPVSELEILDGEQWRDRFKNLKHEIEILQTAEKTEQRKKERRQLMESIGYIYDEAAKHFFIRTPEYSDTNFFSEGRVFEDQPDFSDWFNNVAKVDAEKTLKDAQRIREENAAKGERTKNRIDQLKKLHFIQGTNYYELYSEFMEDPEFEESGFAVAPEKVTELSDEEWETFINAISIQAAKFFEIEQQVMERKADEEETRRAELLTEGERVTNYIHKLGQVKVPGVKNQELTKVVFEIVTVLVETREKVEAYVKKSKNETAKATA